MPLMRGRGGRLGVSAEGVGGNVEFINQVIIPNNAPDTEVPQSQRTDANGQQQIIVSIDQALAARVGRGEGQLVKAIQRNFGATVAPVSK